MIECSCLVALSGRAILLVRVRDNKKWYLPGGKVEVGESHQQALCRELSEEISVVLKAENLVHLITVEGPAYREEGKVRLVCYRSENEIDGQPSGEVSELAWLDGGSYHLFAPAVQILYDELEKQKMLGG
ncbi:NUDIX domain-containing protein [Sphingorhabdus sp. EL138]|jgi:8-oxo-dGTP pyrophosphatase MutT (NUDIX family)|uniref:NUDIX hydrolase n=1 Tax=Sphingorhabdus sp. EL138 TaxID=2073156 RepID=UPI000D69638F